jgi:parvulin-like peptidyl-prolyl isomerase
MRQPSLPRDPVRETSMRGWVATVLLVALLPAAAPAQTYLVNRIVLRVNDRIATLADFQRALSERRSAILGADDLDDARRRELLSSAGRRVMSEMYEEMLLLSRAEQLVVTITDAQLEQALVQTRANMGLEDDAAFRQALATSEITEQQLRDRLRRSLMIQEVMGREVQSRVEIDEEELRRVWRENQDAFRVPAAVRLTDVVVLEQGRSSAAVAETARRVRAELLAGAPAADVAKRFADEGQPTEAVDLGWVERDELDPTLAAAGWDLEIGGVSEPVAGRGGRHVLQLVERRAESVRPFEEVKEAIETRERQRRTGEVYQDYLKEVEGRAYVHMQLPPEAEGFRGLADEAAAQDDLAAEPSQPALDEAPAPPVEPPPPLPAEEEEPDAVGGAPSAA